MKKVEENSFMLIRIMQHRTGSVQQDPGTCQLVVAQTYPLLPLNIH